MTKNGNRAGKGAGSSVGSSNITAPEFIRDASAAQATPRLGGAYDKAFEAKITHAIGTVIREASTLPNGALYIRGLETLRALSTAMAGYLAMMPEAVGTGDQLRATIDHLANELFEAATAAAIRPGTQSVRAKIQYIYGEGAS